MSSLDHEVFNRIISLASSNFMKAQEKKGLPDITFEKKLFIMKHDRDELQPENLFMSIPPEMTSGRLDLPFTTDRSFTDL